MCLCPMSSNLLSSREPHVVVRSEVLDNSFESDESPWSADPSSVKRDSDVSRLAFQALFSDDTTYQLHRSRTPNI
jgi:hypothetical protein